MQTRISHCTLQLIVWNIPALAVNFASPVLVSCPHSRCIFMSVRQLDQNQDIQPAPCHYMNASFNGFFKWFQDGWGSSSSSSFTIVVNTFSLVSGLILGTIRRLYLCTDNKPTSSPIGNYVRPTDRPINQNGRTMRFIRKLRFQYTYTLHTHINVYDICQNIRMLHFKAWL